MRDTTPTITTKSLLARLRALLPDRPLGLAEALGLAELQADRLLRLRRVVEAPVFIDVIAGLSHVDIEHDADLAKYNASGTSYWDQERRHWVICLNPEEPVTRRRYTALHEYKHILDHFHHGLAGPLPRHIFGLPPVEYVAEYFAGCVLMPRRLLKAAYLEGIRELRDLAQLFDVSTRAMQVRLDQLGLRRTSDEPTSPYRYRCPHGTVSYAPDDGWVSELSQIAPKETSS